MLAGAVNTAIVGSNGVMNRVSEDGILPDWFRRPHPRFGTSYRILNLVVFLQLFTILLSRGNIFLLGEAYAFGVMWSFAMKGLAVLVLRYKRPGEREFRVPLNFKIGSVEIPVGLGLITLTLFALCIINLFTKQIATLSGVTFTIIFFAAFTLSERYTHKRAAASVDMDQFNVASQASSLRRASAAARATFSFPSAITTRSTISPPSSTTFSPNAATSSSSTFAFCAARLPAKANSKPSSFSAASSSICSRRRFPSPKSAARPIKLAVVPASDPWEGIVRAATSLESTSIVLGHSTKYTAAEQARQIGDSWEALPDPRPPFNLEIYSPGGQREFFMLGPHSPQLTPNEVRLVHQLWLRFCGLVAPEELHHHDVVHFALNEVEEKISKGRESEIVARLRAHLENNRKNRPPQS